jgi:hypothetical protein
MTAPPTAQTASASLARDLIRAARYYLGGRRGVLILTAIALAAGLALNWNRLVAAGIAPVILTVLPCAVMCGAGLCVNKLLGRGACESRPGNPDQPATTPSEKTRDSDA